MIEIVDRPKMSRQRDGGRWSEVAKALESLPHGKSLCMDLKEYVTEKAVERKAEGATIYSALQRHCQVKHLSISINRATGKVYISHRNGGTA